MWQVQCPLCLTMDPSVLPRWSSLIAKPAQPGISLSASIFSLFQFAPIAQHEKTSRLGGIVLGASPVEDDNGVVSFFC